MTCDKSPLVEQERRDDLSLLGQDLETNVISQIYEGEAKELLINHSFDQIYEYQFFFATITEKGWLN